VLHSSAECRWTIRGDLGLPVLVQAALDKLEESGRRYTVEAAHGSASKIGGEVDTQDVGQPCEIDGYVADLSVPVARSPCRP
jgi:hypothetical protein